VPDGRYPGKRQEKEITLARIARRDQLLFDKKIIINAMIMVE